MLAHPAVDAPYTWQLRAEAALRAGRRAEAEELVARALQELPGFDEMIELALKEGFDLPEQSREIATWRGLLKPAGKGGKSGKGRT